MVTEIMDCLIKIKLRNKPVKFPWETSDAGYVLGMPVLRIVTEIRKGVLWSGRWLNQWQWNYFDDVGFGMDISADSN